MLTALSYPSESKTHRPALRVPRIRRGRVRNGPSIIGANTCTMTVSEYYGAVRRFGLLPSRVPNVYLNTAGDFYCVPDPTKHTPNQRLEIVEKLKVQLGIG